MKVFRVLEVTTTADAYDITAKTEEEAIQKINASMGGITTDITRAPEYDFTVSRDYQCEGDTN